jgi:uncharacterized protein (TIGR01370 family)
MFVRCEILGVFLSLLSFSLAAPIHWAAYYAADGPVAPLAAFDLLVFDGDRHPPLSPLVDRGKTVIGYLSVGEVENTRAHFADVKNEGILLHENENWKGSYLVDVRDPRWSKRIVEQLVPEMLRRGFHGIFLDTVDNAPHLERTDPRRFRGMTDAMANLIRTIRLHYPQTKLIMNRGFEILPQVEQHIDMVLAESIFADYDFATRTYKLVPQNQYQELVKVLQTAKQRRPQLTVLTLDYWNPDDAAGITRIYSAQRANGFHPYVATVELDRIIEEPKR